MKDLVPTRIYDKLFSGLYLRRKRILIPHFADLVDFLAWERLEKKRGIVVYSLDDKLLSHLKDVTEKIGFMLLSHDILKKSLKEHRSLLKLPFEQRVKIVRAKQETEKFKNDQYYFYNFVIYTKSSLDSIAITLNSFFGFGFVRGQIDLGKRAFVRKLESSLDSFKDFSPKYQGWIDQIIKYRHAVIHQKSVDIFGIGKSLIPLHPLSWNELEEIREEYDKLKSETQKRQTSKSLKLVSLDSFMRNNIDNMLTLTGLLSAEVLHELKRKHPNHKPSRTHYR